jgi:signal transduction histidine kinase
LLGPLPLPTVELRNDLKAAYFPFVEKALRIETRGPAFSDGDDPHTMPAERKEPPAIQPIAVHLGPLRAQWLAGNDGHDVLVLVRAARLEHKIIYQGVLLDWPLVQKTLRSQVVDLFPDAKLAPLRTAQPLIAERAMTALPIQLDPGPLPEPPPAGWTTLRIGLVLAWTAAFVALAAVLVTGRALVELSERRIRFVSAVTHELRTPLTSLRLYLDLLTSGMVPDETKQKEYLHTLAGESDRLNRLIENVLDFAKLEKRSVQSVRQPIPVKELLQEVQTTWQDRCAAEGKELVVRVLTSPEQTVWTDRRVALQILGNLIDNARKYSRGAEDTRIEVSAILSPRQDRIILAVEDHGPGVSSAEKKSIFRAFRRGKQAETVAGGAGLGLALAKHWVDLLGGTIQYHTAHNGHGACFRVELPIRNDS